MTDFRECTIPQTKQQVKHLGFQLDKVDGMVSMQTADQRKLINIFSLVDNTLCFRYNTTETYHFSFPQTAPNNKTFEAWFSIIEEIAITFAKEIGVQAIGVINSSGTRDKAFLTNKGYEKQKKHFYKKEV